jgi:hypothetical protein
MRDHAYRLFEIVAWPAACWGIAELALRMASGFSAGWAPLVITTACAATTIVVSRRRRAMLMEAPLRSDR